MSAPWDAFEWKTLLRRLIQRYGPDEGAVRFLAQKQGTDPDVVAWRSLGERGRAA